jgi:Mrp family chromosome partitioning ATPase
MWKSSTQQKWPDGEFKDQLSRLVAAAGSAGVSRSTIATALEVEAEAMRRLAAVNASLNDTPKIRSGNIPDNMGGRLAKMIRG